MCTMLADQLSECFPGMSQHIKMPSVDWQNMVAKIQDDEDKRTPSLSCFGDEQVWTFLVCCGYSVNGSEGIRKLSGLLAPGEIVPDDGKLWFEVRPMSPREREGNTRLDLAVGFLKTRGVTASGIELDVPEDPRQNTWACFCECKWLSDLSIDVTHDVNRNQLTRVIENLLFFQCAEILLASPHVTLITPAIFRPNSLEQSNRIQSFSRLFQYKFVEYKSDPSRIAADIGACRLRQRSGGGWIYPNMDERVKLLRLNCVTYEELFQEMPASELREPLTRFFKERGTIVSV